MKKCQETISWHFFLLHVIINDANYFAVSRRLPNQSMILLLVSFNELAFYIWLLICIMAQWGMTAFLWQHYCYSAVYLYGKKIYFFDKRRKRNIGLENKVGIKAALGNTVYAFFDENDNKLFEIQMKKKNASELMQLIKNEISNRNP